MAGCSAKLRPTLVDQAMVSGDLISAEMRQCFLRAVRQRGLSAWTFHVELLGRCSLKDSRENDQSQINMFRVRGLRVTKLTQHNTPNEKSCSSLPVERGIAADSPSLWNQCYEPLMGVVCSLRILCQEDMENGEQFSGGKSF